MVSGRVSALFEKKDSHRNSDLRALGLGEIIGEANLGVQRLFLENAAGASTQHSAIVRDKQCLKTRAWCEF